MAKEEQLSEEELEKQKRDQEREERIKAEEEKEKERLKEKEKKKKDREKRIKLREKQQKKKENRKRKQIKKMINFPFKILLQTSLLLTLIVFILKYFGDSNILIDAMLSAFYIFLTIFLGGGIIMTAIYYVLSQRKEKELKEIIELEAEKLRLEEEEKKKEELEYLEHAISDSADVESRRQEEMKKFRDAQAQGRSLPPVDKSVQLDINPEEQGLPEDMMAEDLPNPFEEENFNIEDEIKKEITKDLAAEMENEEAFELDDFSQQENIDEEKEPAATENEENM